MYFKEGATYSFLTVSNLSVRLLSNGFIFDVAGSSIFPKSIENYFMIGILNSRISTFLIKIISPTVNYQVGDLARIPMPEFEKNTDLSTRIVLIVKECIELKKEETNYQEVSWEFFAPLSWSIGIYFLLDIEKELAILETNISKKIYSIYEIDQSDIEKIESESGKLPGDMVKKESLSPGERETLKGLYLNKHVPAEVLTTGEDLTDEEGELTSENEPKTKKRGQKRFLTFEEICLASKLHPETIYNFIIGNNLEREEERAELAFQWISYAVGIIMGRFKPGIENAPGRGQFSNEVNSKLSALVDEDAIMVIDEGHNDDLPAKVMQALEFMLGADDAAQVVKKATGKEGSAIELLRPFLGNPFFKRHIQQYRSRPVYWLLQSPNRKYSVWIFHERLNKDTLFRIRTEYVDPKKNHLDAQAK